MRRYALTQINYTENGSIGMQKVERIIYIIRKIYKFTREKHCHAFKSC